MATKPIYLFDWGDTLMVDIPGQPGKMCDWPEVIACPDAATTLAQLSQQADLYIATNAAESTPDDIEHAFSRVDLARYISGYFCFTNIGARKGQPEFLQRIIEQLDAAPEQIIYVGDSLDKDVLPALAAGLNVVWLNGDNLIDTPKNVRRIKSLAEL
ncbi:HAD family hydrolase [Corallincola platygyrae]|uniref:HAD family hydrolase n=1 Tax=Corallincola platygyrae TaxID=1193278 RepID=A0ABW4XRH5_9GAMM